MIIIFGKPGAGKTSVANAATNNIILQSRERYTDDNDKRSVDESKQHSQSCCVGLDLDICIPAWMRRNFSKGIYPSLEQRAVFAESACDYVETEVRKARDLLVEDDDDASISVIIAFSFVNNDLRGTFRSRFPNAAWVLVDVTDDLAQDRIDQRVDHFYKGAPVEKLEEEETPNSEETLDSEETGRSRSTENNDGEWNFAPVNFHHIVLDGKHSIAHNAGRVADICMELKAA